MDGVRTRVAKGQIILFTDGRRMMHGVVLPLGMKRVRVQEVVTSFESWSLPHPLKTASLCYGK